MVYFSPTVYQERNVHSILKDFEQEIPGYLENDKIIDVLEAIHFQTKDVQENLMVCYDKMIQRGYFSKEEFKLVEMWNKILG